MISETSARDKFMTSMYALGWTQHSKGSQNIRCMAMLQLILGNIGVRGGGMNALRGHSNIQGLTDLGLMSNLIPGYLTLPTEREADLASLHVHARLQADAAGTDELLAELQEVLRELPEGDVGLGGDARERLRLQLSAEARRAGLRRLESLGADAPGQDERLLLPGLQPAAVLPQQGQAEGGDGQAEVPGRHGPARDRDGAVLGGPRRVQSVQARGDQDGGLRASDHVLCRGRGLADELLAAGCNGIGRAARLRARPRPTSGSWRRSTCG